MSEFSEIEEMYLKRMFEVHSQTPDAIVKTTQLAEMMGISPASVTEMIQRLSDRGMVTHIPYRGSRLTPEGFQLAASVKRREYLLQILLSDIIGFKGNVKEVACKMEHAVENDLETTIDRFLGFPELSADGSRIPGIHRTFEPIGIGTLLPVAAIPEGASASVELILASDVEVVTLREIGLMVGSKLVNQNGETTIDGKRCEISPGMAMKVLVRVTEMGA